MWCHNGGRSDVVPQTKSQCGTATLHGPGGLSAAWPVSAQAFLRRLVITPTTASPAAISTTVDGSGTVDTCRTVNAL